MEESMSRDSSEERPTVNDKRQAIIEAQRLVIEHQDRIIEQLDRRIEALALHLNKRIDDHIAATNARFADFDRQVDRAVRLSLLEADTKHHSPFGSGQTSIPCPSDQAMA
jgi:hypothetical protein